MIRLITENRSLLDRLARLVGKIDDPLYAGRPAVGSSVGAHVRHVVEFYAALLEGLDEGRVDYEARRRARNLEGDRAAVRVALAELRRQLLALSGGQGRRPLVVLSHSTASAQPIQLSTSLARELDFLERHTLHHLAHVAERLRLQGFDPGDDLGVARATLAARRSRRPER